MSRFSRNEGTVPPTLAKLSSSRHTGDCPRTESRTKLRTLILRTVVLTSLLLATSCGYHVSGHADLLPKSIKTIAVPAFSNNTIRYRLSDRLAGSITREFNSRTRYRVVNDPNDADAILRGTVLNLYSATTTFDSTTGRAAGVEINVALSVSLVERATGKTLYTNPGMYIRERYEISRDQVAYFEESDTALDRVSRNVAQAVVSAILEAF